MNVLEIIQAAQYELALTAPAAVAAATDSPTLHLKNRFYAAGREARGRRKWPQLKRTHTITTVNNQNSYQLPEDYWGAIPLTQWNQTNLWEFEGGLSDPAFNAELYGLVGLGVFDKYRIFGPDQNPASNSGQFKVYPTPGSTAETLSFDYISKSWLLPRNWVASTVFAAGAYCNASGNIYQTTAGGTSGTTVPSHTSGTATDGGITDWAYISAPYETIVADTDICLFSDDLMIAGIKKHSSYNKGQQFQLYAAQFETALKQEFARWGSVTKISMADAPAAGLIHTIPGDWSL